MKNVNVIRAICLLFLFLVLTPQETFSKELKFVQITDSHFSSGVAKSAQREVSHTQLQLEKTIADINGLKDVDFVAFTGDNIDTANADDLKKFLIVANELNVPYYVVIGNHEVFKSQNFDKKEYMRTVRKYSKYCKPKNANYIFEKKGIYFFVVDGAKEVIPGPAGYYKESTLAWLDRNLTKHENDTVIILQHFPIVEPYFNRSHTTYNIKDYEAVLKKHHNVIAIFSGHYHANGEINKDGIYHVSTPALLEPPYNYKVVEVCVKSKKDIQIYTQLRHAE